MTSSLWDEAIASSLRDENALRVYSSRLLGCNPSLAVFGGGNTSLKLINYHENKYLNYVIKVKCSGKDLSEVAVEDFVTLDLEGARALLAGPPLEGAEFQAALMGLRLAPTGCRPSIEALMHAAIPAPYVDHTHADAILSIANTPRAMEHLKNAFGGKIIVVPYCHSGFSLARGCVEALKAGTSETIGLVLMNHGVVSFGETAKASYLNMLELVQCAEDYLAFHGVLALPVGKPYTLSLEQCPSLAGLRAAISREAGVPMLLVPAGGDLARPFLERTDLAELTMQGPATPQHVIFTKRVPLIGRDVGGFAASYREYAQRWGQGMTLSLPDYAPRIVLDPELGIRAAGVNPWHAQATATVYRHSLEIMWRAQELDGYVSLPPADILAAEIEYGGLETRLREKAGEKGGLMGEIILMAGLPPPLARRTAAVLLAHGAAVAVCCDVPDVAGWFPDEGYIGLRGTWNSTEQDEVLRATVERFGGVDVVFSGEAVIPSSLCRVLLAHAPRGGRWVKVSGQEPSPVRQERDIAYAVVSLESLNGESGGQNALKACLPPLR